MKALVLEALLLATLGAALAHSAAIYLGLDGGAPDLGVAAAMASATIVTYKAISA